MPAKKITPKKKSVKKNPSVKAVKKITVKEEKKDKKAFKIKTPIIIAAAIILILAGLIYYFKNQFIVAVVNGQPISRLALIRQLEKQSGKSVLDSIITKTLVIQEAQKQGVKVTEEQIDEQINKIKENLKAQGQNLDELLKMDNMSQVDFRKEIKLQKMLEELVGKDASVSAEEIQAFIKENKSYFPEGTTEEEMKKTAEEQLKQQNLSSKVQKWLSDLREKAQINYWMNF